jgi:hypothetical protein
VGLCCSSIRYYGLVRFPIQCRLAHRLVRNRGHIADSDYRVFISCIPSYQTFVGRRSDAADRPVSQRSITCFSESTLAGAVDRGRRKRFLRTGQARKESRVRSTICRVARVFLRNATQLRKSRSVHCIALNCLIGRLVTKRWPFAYRLLS